jgi:hypothetical protein
LQNFLSEIILRKQKGQQVAMVLKAIFLLKKTYEAFTNKDIKIKPTFDIK